MADPNLPAYLTACTNYRPIAIQAKQAAAQVDAAVQAFASAQSTADTALAALEVALMAQPFIQGVATQAAKQYATCARNLSAVSDNATAAGMSLLVAIAARDSARADIVAAAAALQANPV